MSKATTKFAIAFAFKELLLEKSIDKITINDITEKCGINRQTFYYHFHDIYELIEWICETDADHVLKQNKTYDIVKHMSQVRSRHVMRSVLNRL